MNEATQRDGSAQSSESVKPQTAPYISRRPAWASTTRVEPDTVVHNWASEIVAEDIDETTGQLDRVRVELLQEDTLYVNDNGVVLDPGEPRVFLLDTYLDIPNARKLAAAINECCDQYEGHGGAS